MRTTRRGALIGGWWLLAGRAFGLQFRSFRRPKVKPVTAYTVLIGTDTSKGGKGIYRARFESVTGQLSELGVAAETVQPSYLALGPAGARRMLYAVNEAADASAAVSTFQVDPRTGELREVGKVSAGVPGPCYVSIDATGHAVFTANYSGGGVSSYRVQGDGTLAGPVEQVNFHDARFGADGPVKDRQDGPHPHSATISPDNRFLVVNDLGHDTIVSFAIDADGARMSGEPSVFHTEAGAGPRHVVFHPNGRWLYGVNELSSTVNHYLWTATHGATPQALLVRAGEPVRTTDAGFTGKNTAAEVAVSPNGAFLYVSNRGENSLVVFAIAPGDGSLKVVQRISCGGATPRQFTLDPTGRWLLCGNQGSDSVTVFRRDVGSGRLEGPVQTLAVPAPYFVLLA